MFYYPCTLGSEKDPLPVGKSYEITTPVKNPPFKYKPQLMWDDELGREYDIPPGPNSPVGNVWIGTTRRSVGIHGTPNPENISKNHSHGCIRLANWDANQLANRVGPGVKLEFVQ
jgi:lipoprotein-anchoring transpeptidase ErfK/SrfK